MHPGCPDFDLCEGCEAHPIPLHPDRHPLLKIRSPDTVIPKINSGLEQQACSTSPISNPVTPWGSDYYGHGYMYNPSASPPITSPAIPRLDTPPDLSSGPTMLPYSTSDPSRDFEDLFSCRMRVPYNPCWSAPFVNHVPFGAGPTVLVAQPSESDHSSRSTSPGTSIWQPPVRQPDAQEASSFLAVQNFYSAPPSSTCILPSHELNHLIKDHSLSPAEPKAIYEESPVITNGNVASTPLVGNTPFQSPLGDEALLKRPANLDLEPSDIAPVSPANHSLASLLKDYHSATLPSLSHVVQESAGGVHKILTAAFVLDVTVPDGQNFPPGAEFVKCWRMINDGARDWPETTELVFVAGTPLLKETSPQSVKVGSVKVGAEIDLWTGELKVCSFFFFSFPCAILNSLFCRHLMLLVGTLRIGVCETTRVNCLGTQSGWSTCDFVDASFPFLHIYSQDKCN
jgi:next-to-BRCA1 protein 1